MEFLIQVIRAIIVRSLFFVGVRFERVSVQKEDFVNFRHLVGSLKIECVRIEKHLRLKYNDYYRLLQ